MENLKISFVSSRELLEILDTYNIDRIVLGGGEPLLDPNICHIIKLLRKSNASLVLLTNCYLLDDYVELPSLFNYDDIIVASIKCIDPVKHREITGKSPRRALKNILMLYNKYTVNLKIETVFVPELVDVPDIVKLAEWIEKNMPDIELIIDMYIPVPGLPYRRPDEDDTRRLLDELSKVNIKISLRKPRQVQSRGRVVYNGRLVMSNYKTDDIIHLVHPTIPEDMLAPHT